jgi:hypothetical protein
MLEILDFEPLTRTVFSTPKRFLQIRNSLCTKELRIEWARK